MQFRLNNESQSDTLALARLLEIFGKLMGFAILAFQNNLLKVTLKLYRCPRKVAIADSVAANEKRG
jgi:hypothetical protein